MLNKFSTIILGTMLGLRRRGIFRRRRLRRRHASPVAGGDRPGKCRQRWHRSGQSQKEMEEKWNNDNWNGNWNNNNWNGNWNNNNHNWKYRKHRRGYDNGVYFSLPLIIGGAYGANQYYGDDYYDDGDYGYDDGDYGGGLSSRHVRYCLNKYQSYNPRNNPWVAYSGRVKQCDSPYL